MALNTAVTDTKWSPNFSAGRPAGAPNVIICHHWGADGQSHQGVVDYLCRANGNSSAHYVASGGRVTQLVHDYDRAWHAGPDGNPRGIGIELRPEMAAADVERAATLIAAIREEWGPLPLRCHSDFMATACPGQWRANLGTLDRRAREILAAWQQGATPPTPTQVEPVPTGPLTVDGIWGAQTTRALQQINRTPIDGIVSSQDVYWRDMNPGLGGGWEWVTDPVGSQLVAHLQAAWGVHDRDGLIGPDTIRHMQTYYGTPADGRLDEGSQAIRAMQAAINKQLA